jgi:hypothetical protein
VKVLAWYIDLNGIGTKILSNFNILLVLKKCDILIIDTRWVSNKRRYQSNTGADADVALVGNL